MAGLKGRLGGLRWRTRLTLWLAAGLAGLAAVGFAELSDLAQAGFARLFAGRPWLPFLLTPAVGMGVVWLTVRFFPGTQGSGIPQVIAATRLAAARQPVSSLVSLRIAAGKIVLGVAGLFGGFSAGREGPSVQVAASLVHAAHRFLPRRLALREADLILAGAAAGIAAAFNTPLAGIVFAIEELGRRLEARTSGVLIVCVILAGLMAISLQGNYTYFGQIRVGAVSTAILLPLLASSLACGVLGGVFSRLLILPQKCGHWRLWRWRAAHPVLFAGLCGLAVALVGWTSGGASHGSGYAVTANAIAGKTALGWDEPFAKFLATVATYYSGIPGGIFAPCLAVGAGLGFDLARLLGGDAHAVVALCMAAFLAAVTQSPITAAVIVMEMIDNHGMVVSLMAAALIAKAVSSRFGPELYQQLSLGFLPAGRVSAASAR